MYSQAKADIKSFEQYHLLSFVIMPDGTLAMFSLCSQHCRQSGLLRLRGDVIVNNAAINITGQEQVGVVVSVPG
jgi:hypothetical protein